ncbi:L,D-transpeptidase family protein [Capillimicrobium parvum]|uniref:L,D-TPase catalytic domain-containing protein n=1 Tax=Capillimicrobium parvum TaxID=2884022 RepID=A0A9E7C7C5_9ACTN|nr:L,D-transpeptidase family protein [Capillimicrobium parvum]UGS39267.1 hypothetical protein DSM104329_05701 [Capillimicrobium parvum]
MRPVSLAVIGLLLVPAAAAAQEPMPPIPTPPPAPAPAPAPAPPPAPAPAPPAPPAPTPPPVPTPPPAPAAGTLSLNVAHEALAHSKLRVQGTLSPAVRGQRVTVTIKRGRHTLRSVKVRAGSRGTFLVGYTPRSGGRITIRASHAASAEVGAARAAVRRVDVIVPHATPGSHGSSVRWLQRKLAGMHYSVSRGGTFDDATARAVMAYRKVNGMARTQVADRSVFQRLARGMGEFKVRYPDHGRHVEGDLTHQVVALINPGGKVYRIYPTSSGKPSTPTVLGNFKVYMKTPGTNAKGMVDSNYFIRGYAIHGYADVPNYAASHGCLRVPVPNAAFIFNWVRIGTPVDVYYR